MTNSEYFTTLGTKQNSISFTILSFSLNAVNAIFSQPLLRLCEEPKRDEP